MACEDSIVVGAGIWGCTLARRLAEAGRKVLVLEKRAAVGGSCWCAMTNGVAKYGCVNLHNAKLHKGR